jgi:hypothetical protein
MEVVRAILTNAAAHRRILSSRRKRTRLVFSEQFQQAGETASQKRYQLKLRISVLTGRSYGLRISINSRSGNVDD